MVSIIVAMTENGVIGRAGAMPWHASADLKRFKALTMGHHLVMGRKTYDSIGRPLPGRVTVVLSRSSRFPQADVHEARTLQEALRIAAGDKEVFITGGAEVYRSALPWADRIYLTRLHVALPGDTYFPKVNWSDWNLVSKESHIADANNDHDYSFLVYERKKP